MDIRQIRLRPVYAGLAAPPEAKPFLDANRVVFLGDSITYGGEYVEFIETYLRAAFPGAALDFINLGLPSETVSGLSEPGHAGGAFPRPDLHERLDRVLQQLRPELIIACYGMNDGIYYPFGEERFGKFQDGMRRLRDRAAVLGAQVIHLTPPVFDPVPLKGRTLPAGLAEYRQPFEGYNGVLDRYTEWLLAQREQGWQVVDAHGPMNNFLTERRRQDPGFLLANDGVHANTQGHWLIAREVLRHLQAPTALVASDTPAALLEWRSHNKQLLKLVGQRQRVMRDSWLTRIGHRRPGMSKGQSLDEAEREVSDLDDRIRALTVRE
jgi:lysophospholipase L1-like esterase